MSRLIAADHGPALVVKLGIQRLVPLGFVLLALVLSAALVQAVSGM